MCSDHFVDGSPSEAHLFPTLQLGYDAKRKINNLQVGDKRASEKKARLSNTKLQPSEQNLENSIKHDHSYFDLSCSRIEGHWQPAMPDDDDDDEYKINTFFHAFLHSYYYMLCFSSSCAILGFVFLMLQNCYGKLNIIRIMYRQIAKLKEENVQLRKCVEHLKEKEKSCVCKLSLFEQLIKKIQMLHSILVSQT